jgi:hypothetical protein
MTKINKKSCETRKKLDNKIKVKKIVTYSQGFKVVLINKFEESNYLPLKD